ncbi:NACHT domain-containing protein [Spirosoma sp. HMF4905]|uniref:NACHT domain-containing protein n=1 Tax=Spirosoma arboris TaxID=2682092 RepID=A0A7K1SG98_9BACT|nr:NB-ARC domain-containing protein [Spirosoma arboris]MVM32847.1 NACHT domain-containing protein [Spirosoma arboris]
MRISQDVQKFSSLLLHGGINCLLVNATTAGVTGPAIMLYELGKAITGNLASNHIASLTNLDNLKKRLTLSNPKNLNHDLERVFRQSVIIAVEYVKILFLMEINDDIILEINLSKRDRKLFIRAIEDFFNENIKDIKRDIEYSERLPLDKSLIHDPSPFLESIINYMLSVVSIKFDIDTENRIIKFYKDNLPYCFQLAFTEALKNDDHGFKAFQIWILEDIQIHNIEMQESQHNIIEAIKSITSGNNIISSSQLNSLLKIHSENVYNHLQIFFKQNVRDTFENLAKQIKEDFKKLYLLSLNQYALTQKILELLEKLLDNTAKTTQNIIPRILTLPPFDSKIFIGREEEIYNLEKSFTESRRNIIILNGEGGIGKTTIASQYWIKNSDSYKHLIWLFCNDGIEKALYSIADKLNVSLRNDIESIEESFNSEEKLGRFIQALANLQAPCLLVLDNVNSIYDLNNQIKNLKRLSNFHILITSRVNNISEYFETKVKPLKETSALELFKKYYHGLQAQDENLLKEILKSVNYNTLIIELFSKSLQQKNIFKITYNLKDLLNDLQDKGLLLLETTNIQTDYLNFQTAKPEEILRAMYDMQSLSGNEKNILNIFSALSAEKIAYQMLVTIANPVNADLFDESLNQLFLKGWIDFDVEEKTFKISPVIQQIVLDKNKDTIFNSCLEMIKNLSKIFEDFEYYMEANGYIKHIESVTKVLKINSIETAKLAYNLSCYYTYHSRQYLYAEKMVFQILTYLKNQDIVRENEKFSCEVYMIQAEILENLGRLIEAGGFYTKARVLSEKIKVPFDKLSYAYYNTRIGKFAEAEPILFRNYTYFSNKHHNEKKIHNMYKFSLLVYNISCVMRAQERFDESIKFAKETINLYNEIGNEEFTIIAKLNYFKSLLYSNRYLDDAEIVLTEILDYFQANFENTDAYWGHLYVTMGYYYGIKGNLKDSIKNYEEGIKILNNSIGKNSNLITECNIQKCLFTWNCYKSGKIARSHLEGICKEFILDISGKIENLSESIGFFNQWLHKFLSFLFEYYNEINDSSKAIIFSKKLEELVRVTTVRAKVRTSEFVEQKISVSQKPRYKEKFDLLHSLPDDINSIKIQKFKLPFFKTFKLFAITYITTPKEIIRYVLSNDDESYAIDYTNKSIYEVCKKDGLLNANNITLYIKFFFDCVCGKNGFFYIINNLKDVPWRKDVNINIREKKAIKMIINRPNIVTNNSEFFQAENIILFRSSLFNSTIRVSISSETYGHCSMFNEKSIQFKSWEDHIFLDMVDYKKIIDAANGGEIDIINAPFYDTQGKRVVIENENDIFSNVSAQVEPNYF